MALKPMLRWLISVAVVVAGSGAHAITPSNFPKPAPQLDPSSVVRIQLDALAHVDEPVRDAGLAIVYGFASPNNHAQLGSFRQFAALIRAGYPEMLNHRSVLLNEVIVRNDHAIQGVDLIDRAGNVHHFTFLLSRHHDAPLKDCWLTDGVLTGPTTTRLET